MFLDGAKVGYVERNAPQNVSIAAARPPGSDGNTSRLAVLVEAMGRVNFGCVPDTKGLQSPHVRLNGAAWPHAGVVAEPCSWNVRGERATPTVSHSLGWCTHGQP